MNAGTDISLWEFKSKIRFLFRSELQNNILIDGKIFSFS